MLKNDLYGVEDKILELEEDIFNQMGIIPLAGKGYSNDKAVLYSVLSEKAKELSQFHWLIKTIEILEGRLKILEYVGKPIEETGDKYDL